MGVSEYRSWLRDLVELSDPFYDLFFDIAWRIEFEYFVPNDKNRAYDGVALRWRFEQEKSTPLPALEQCKMLEFLVSLANRMNDAMYDYKDPNRVPYFFHLLLINLELDPNGKGGYGSTSIEKAFDTVIYRKYDYSGNNGGLFPLRRPTMDQRNVEIWYQMMAYLTETMF